MNDPILDMEQGAFMYVWCKRFSSLLWEEEPTWEKDRRNDFSFFALGLTVNSVSLEIDSEYKHRDRKKRSCLKTARSWDNHSSVRPTGIKSFSFFSREKKVVWSFFSPLKWCCENKFTTRHMSVGSGRQENLPRVVVEIGSCNISRVWSWGIVAIINTWWFALRPQQTLKGIEGLWFGGRNFIRGAAFLYHDVAKSYGASVSCCKRETQTFNWEKD